MNIWKLETVTCNGQYHQDGREEYYQFSGVYKDRKLLEKAIKKLQKCEKCIEANNPYFFPHCKEFITEYTVVENEETIERFL